MYTPNYTKMAAACGNFRNLGHFECKRGMLEKEIFLVISFVLLNSQTPQPLRVFCCLKFLESGTLTCVS